MIYSLSAKTRTSIKSDKRLLFQPYSNRSRVKDTDNAWARLESSRVGIVETAQVLAPSLRVDTAVENAIDARTSVFSHDAHMCSQAMCVIRSPVRLGLNEES